MIKQGSNQAIRFFVVESLKDWYREGDPNKPVNKIIVGMFGAVAGAASVFGNTPIDVVKTRMQVSFSNYFSTFVPPHHFIATIDFIFFRVWKLPSTKTH